MISVAPYFIKLWRSDPEAEPAHEQIRPSPSALIGSKSCVDFDHDSAQTLERVPGIGPKLAERIIDHRKDAENPIDLASVRGISDGFSKKLSRIRCENHVR